MGVRSIVTPILKATSKKTQNGSRRRRSFYIHGFFRRKMAEEGQVIACHNVDVWKAQLEKGKEKLIVVDFTASWCPPCKFIAPIFAELAKKFTNVTFLKVDVDELKSVAADCQVEAMPTFIFMKDGKTVDKIVGADKDGLQAMVAKHSA